MSTNTNTQNVSYNPPRMINEPPQPLPQTVCATLEHSGIPTSAIESITDVPPIFDWMALIQLYKSTFRVSVTNTPKEALFSTYVLVHNQTANGVISNKMPIPWNYIPFLASRWWSGTVSYKFIAIKPKAMTGKLLIRYAPDPTYSFSDDSLRRNTSIEWDLGKSSEIEFDIPAFNPIEARPTWLPRVEPRKTVDPNSGYWIAWGGQSLPQVEWNFGWLTVEVAQKIVPGSVFPDSIRILVFQVFKNANFYLPTDLRGSSAHCLSLGMDSVKWPA